MHRPRVGERPYKNRTPAAPRAPKRAGVRKEHRRGPVRLFALGAIGPWFFPLTHEFDALLGHAQAGAFVVAPRHMRAGIPALLAILEPGVGLSPHVWHLFCGAFALSGGLSIGAMQGQRHNEREETEERTHDTPLTMIGFSKPSMRRESPPYQSG